MENSKANLAYEDVSLGDGDVLSGRVRPRNSGVFDVTIKARANEYLSRNSTSFRSQVGSNSVHLSSYAELRGKVHVTKIIKRHKTAVFNCTMTLNLRMQAIQDLVCR